MRRANNRRRKSGLATRAHLIMRVTLQLIHYLISLRAYRRMIVMIPLILLKYPFLMNLMIVMFVAMMPIRMMLMEMNLLLFLMLRMKLLLLHPHMIVLLSFWILQTTLYRTSLCLLRIILMGCLLHMIILIDIICICLLLLLAIIMREELHLRLSMFPTR